MKKSPEHWAIVGGGLLGMTLSWEAARLGHRVTLFEASPVAGGLASAWRLDDITWDRHYHVTLFSDAALRGLLTELGLDSEMCWTKTQTGFFADGKLYPFSGALDYARFPLLTLTEKIQFGVAILRASRLKDPSSLRDVTVEDWLTGLSGKAVFEKLWRPLLRCKLGDDFQSTSATFMWATIQRLYAARRSGLRQELFGYLPGGYSRMLETFSAALQARDVEIHLSRPIGSVCALAKGGVALTDAQESTHAFDRAIVSVPAPLAASLCPQLTPQETAQLQSVRYHGILCTSLLLSRPLSNFYVTNILDSSIPLTGVIEMTALVDRATFGGRSLVYLPRYLPSQHPSFEQKNEDLQAEAIRAIRQMYPGLAPSHILACQVSRARHVFPCPTVGSGNSVPVVDTSVPGVHILNSAHIAYGTLNVNETVQLAQYHARRIHELSA